MIGLADELCAEHLLRIKRSSYGTIYDHCLRVTVSLIDEFNIIDPTIITAGILHDMIEDSPMTGSDIQGLFGLKVLQILRPLNRNGVRWEQLKLAHPNKNIYRAMQNHMIMKEKGPVSLIKSVDKLDNLRDMTMIKSNDKKYSRIPYWITEVKISILPYTIRYYPSVADEMTKEIASIEAIFSSEIAKLFDNYSRRLDEALYLWEKV